MWTMITSFFGSVKNIGLAAFTIFGGLLFAKAKYDAYQAGDKLKTIENKIAKTNVVITKTKAKAKAQAVKAETTAEVEVLRELQKEAKVQQKEMQKLEEVAAVAFEKVKVVQITRKIGKKFKVEV